MNNGIIDKDVSKKQMNDFYNAIFKKISNTNFTNTTTTTALNTNPIKINKSR